MSESEGKRGLVSFLRRLGVQRPALSSQVSAAEVLRRLAQIEDDAAAYYSALAQHSDLPWVRQFALRLAEEEKGHKQGFLDLADSLAGAETGEKNRLDAPLSEELINLLSARITLPAKGAARTAVYLSEKDAVELAIQAERTAVQLLTELHTHIPSEQRAHIDRVIQEEMQHQLSLETLHRKHFG